MSSNSSNVAKKPGKEDEQPFVEEETKKAVVTPVRKGVIELSDDEEEPEIKSPPPKRFKADSPFAKPSSVAKAKIETVEEPSYLRLIQAGDGKDFVIFGVRKGVVQGVSDEVDAYTWPIQYELNQKTTEDGSLKSTFQFEHSGSLYLRLEDTSNKIKTCGEYVKKGVDKGTAPKMWRAYVVREPELKEGQTKELFLGCLMVNIIDFLQSESTKGKVKWQLEENGNWDITPRDNNGDPVYKSLDKYITDNGVKEILCHNHFEGWPFDKQSLPEGAEEFFEREPEHAKRYFRKKFLKKGDTTKNFSFVAGKFGYK